MEIHVVHDENENKLKYITDYRSTHGTNDLHFAVSDVSYGDRMFFMSHWHSEYEIIFLLDHHLDFYVDGKLYYLLPGQALFIDSNSIHGHARQDMDYGHYVAFHFGEEFLFPDSQSYIYKQYFMPLRSGKYTFTRQIRGQKGYEKEILRLLKELTLIGKNVQENALVIQICLLQIYHIMFQESAFDLCQESKQQKKLIKSVTAYINQNYTSEILIRDLAGFLNVNVDYFCKLFKQNIGISPKKYIQNLRINRAVSEMNANPECSLAEVAVRSGFTEPNYFARSFKQYMGISPSAYKKQVQDAIRRL